MTARRADLGFGAAFLALALVLWVESERAAAPGREIARDPIWFPRVLILGLVGVAALLVARALRSEFTATGAASAAAPRPDWGRALLAVGLIGLYFLAFEPVGFVLSTLAAVPALSLALGYRRPVPVLVTTIVTVALLWIVFAELFMLRPPGLGPDDLIRRLQGA